MKFKKRHVVVSAWLIGPLLKAATNSWKNLPSEVQESYEKGHLIFTSDLLIRTLEGNMIGKSTDWLIQGVQGEFYPCKPDIFEKTYEEVK